MRTVARFFGVAAGAFAVALFALSPSAATSPRGDEFWNALWTNGTYDTYEDAKSLVSAADAVVVGHITGVSLSREVNAVPEWGDDGILTFARVDVRISQVLSGTVATRDDQVLTWEAFVPTPGGLDQMKAALPDDEVMLFLKVKPESKETLYDTVNPEAYFVNADGVVKPPVGEPREWAAALAGQPFTLLVDEIAAIRSAEQ